MYLIIETKPSCIPRPTNNLGCVTETNLLNAVYEHQP